MHPEPKTFGRLGDVLIWGTIRLLIILLGWAVTLLAPRDIRRDRP